MLRNRFNTSKADYLKSITIEYFSSTIITNNPHNTDKVDSKSRLTINLDLSLLEVTPILIIQKNKINPILYRQSVMNVLV